MRDPSFAVAYAGLADAHMQLGTDSLSPGKTFPEGRRYAERALELDALLGEAHASLGMYAMWFDYDWSRAEREFARAIELRPNFPGARSSLINADHLSVTRIAGTATCGEDEPIPSTCSAGTRLLILRDP